MITKVSKEGLLIPKGMLGETEEVELRAEPGRIVVVLDPAKDPIRRLGSNPVIAPETDASLQHDKYLYGE